MEQCMIAVDATAQSSKQGGENRTVFVFLELRPSRNAGHLFAFDGGGRKLVIGNVSIEEG